jgi:hypothetical protein
MKSVYLLYKSTHESISCVFLYDTALIVESTLDPKEDLDHSTSAFNITCHGSAMIYQEKIAKKRKQTKPTMYGRL